MHPSITWRATLASVGTDGLTPGGLSTHSEALTVFTGLAFSSNFWGYYLEPELFQARHFFVPNSKWLPLAVDCHPRSTSTHLSNRLGQYE